jgi:dTDP-glucose 4,6-dehydratase
MSEKLLVTGAAGFIGSNFAMHAARQGRYQVVGLDAMRYAANPMTVMRLIDEGVEFIQGDLLDADMLDIAVKQADIVVHFAAESHNDNSISGPRPFVESNVVGTFNLLEAVRKHEKRLHHISTDEVFGDLELEDPQRFTELAPYNPSSPYSATKAASDLLVRAWSRTYQIEVTISNCSNNFGPYQHVEKFIPRQITNVLTGQKPKLYGSGENVRDWIYVDLHSDAVLTILEHGRSGETYLIGADGERSNLEVLRNILELMDKPADWFDWVDDRPGHDLRYAIDSSKLRNELAWNPNRADFTADLGRTIDWYRQNQDWWLPTKAATEAKYKSGDSK